MAHSQLAHIRRPGPTHFLSPLTTRSVTAGGFFAIPYLQGSLGSYSSGFPLPTTGLCTVYSASLYHPLAAHKAVRALAGFMAPPIAKIVPSSSIRGICETPVPPGFTSALCDNLLLGSRLLAANLHIWRPFLYPPPEDALGWA